jgi:serine phosphatase RsbU (regulator of sigma subunit)/ligand-binding sensor domain-containing protein
MKLALLFIFTILLLNCYSQIPKYEISYYSVREYGKGFESTNWNCIQDKNGVLYFGNAGGLLQYDGINWNFISVKKQSAWIKAITINKENVIYIGAQNEFGYLKTEASGKFTYISLSDKLKANEKIFSNIIRIWACENYIAFQAEEALYIYSDGKLNTILPETSFHLSFLVNNELYVRQREIGLMKFSHNKLLLVKGSEFLKNYGVFSILENKQKNNLTIITREDGFWEFNENTFEKERLKTADSTILFSSEIYGATMLNDGNIALNTLSNGIIITNPELKIISITNKNNGLKVNGVNSILQDYQGNIWAALDNGIAQIHYSSPISIYNSKNGISGNICDIVRYNNLLYIGASDGLFVQQNNSYFTSFILFNGFNKAIKNLCLAENLLLVGSQSGLYKAKNNSVEKLFDIDVNSLYYSDKNKLLFVSTKSGLIIYKYNGSFNKQLEIPEIPEEVIRFERKNTENGITLWMGTQLQGIIKLDITTDNKYNVVKYNSSDGLIDNNWAVPFKIEDKIIFSQRAGLLQYVDEETIKKQLPDSLKNQPEFYRGYFDFYNIDTLKARFDLPFYTIKDSKNKIYVNLDNTLGYFDKSNSLIWVTQPFSLADIGKANVFFHEEDSVCWIGGDDGLLMFKENFNKNYDIDFSTLITSVSCKSDSMLYSGLYNTNNNNNSGITEHVLNYNLNTIQFSFVAPFFEGQDKILYSFILIGQDTCFSEWSNENRVTFSNLWEGEYIFKVKAKNAYGHISSECTYNFTVLSPWYRKIWAYLLYVIIFILFIYIGIRINSRRLIAKNKKLEEIILDRTQEIKLKNIVLEHQKQEILDSINYAMRIQKAVLPDDELIKDWLGEHFILFRPKDIVSGDFYWATKHNNYVFFCVADCTGHGVPGAFMSMLCVSFLNEVVLKEEINQADEILNKLRKMIIDSLKQRGISGEQKDGMDITLCVLNRETSELQYAGANNPLYILRNKDEVSIPDSKEFEHNNTMLYEIKADAMPIAIYVNMEPFKLHTIKLLKEDRIFLFSDGYADQFGGPKGKKFMYKTFKIGLIESCLPNMEEQKILIEKSIDNWMAFTNPESGKSFEQIDDICVMGIKI